MHKFIIALSGRKGAGKNTIASFIKDWYCNYSERNYNSLDDDGKEYVRSELTYECSFADTLKNFCIETLGLTYEQCYGTDEEKNSPTKYLWENAPKYLRWKFGPDKTAKYLVASGKYNATELMEIFHSTKTEPKGQMFCTKTGQVMNCADANVLKTGPMTGRDIMQMFGTDLVRQTFGNVWAESTIRRIDKINKPLSVITDNRFPNEVEEVLKRENSFIIRLTRSPFGTYDIHPSESALDEYDWNKPNCFVLDNSEMTIEEQNVHVTHILEKFITGVNI